MKVAIQFSLGQFTIKTLPLKLMWQIFQSIFQSEIFIMVARKSLCYI